MHRLIKEEHFYSAVFVHLSPSNFYFFCVHRVFSEIVAFSVVIECAHGQFGGAAPIMSRSSYRVQNVPHLTSSAEGSPVSLVFDNRIMCHLLLAWLCDPLARHPALLLLLRMGWELEVRVRET